MIESLSTPGKRKATAFLMVFWFAVAFQALRVLLPLTPWSSAAIPDDIAPGVVTVMGIAIGVLFTAQTVSKFSPAVRDGKEPA